MRVRLEAALAKSCATSALIAIAADRPPSCLALAGGADIAVRQQILSERGPQYLTRLRDLTLQRYREWLQTEPVDCGSPKLPETRASVLDTTLLIKPKTQGFEASCD